MLRPVYDETVGIDWDDCEMVERIPGKVSGVPILKDTRLPADCIVSNFDHGCTPEEVADMFEMPIETVQAILDWASRYRAEQANPSRP